MPALDDLPDDRLAAALAMVRRIRNEGLILRDGEPADLVERQAIADLWMAERIGMEYLAGGEVVVWVLP